MLPDVVSDDSGTSPAPGRTLSKSDFVLASSCPAKLFFRENGYPDARDSNTYLQLLAEGGYMVEALAKARYADGVQLEYGRDVVADAARTMAALQAHTVTLFEATLLVGRQQARVDVLEKRGDVIRLIEIKAKSFDGAEHARQLAAGRLGIFRKAKRPHGILAAWEDKLIDIAYQVVLLERLMPGVTIEPYLALVDRSKAAGLDNVPGFFELVRREGRDGSLRLHTARFTGTPVDLAQLDLVTEVSVAGEVALLHGDVEARAAALEARLDAPLEVHTAGVTRDAHCAHCEFRTSGPQPSGFDACWGDLAHASPHVLDLYSVGRAKAPDGARLVPWMFERRTASLLDVPLDGLVSPDANPAGIAARQRRQIEHTRRDQLFVGPQLRASIEALHGPVHFIDFETSRLALPYHGGMRPYGLVAFQWSAHTVGALGETPRHAEWLNTTDVWPNQQFAESLRAAIGNDGPVLTWSHFEAATLDEIVADLATFGRDVPDLVDWMRGVQGRIVDLHQWAQREYYHPGMGGRTSIKVVLDALWQTDPVLRDQFGRWTGLPADAAHDPYAALPAIEIGGVPRAVHEGTGAMLAYQEMMYGEHRHDAATRARWSALLRQYCRLDTLSMVLIVEHWRRQVGLA